MDEAKPLFPKLKTKGETYHISIESYTPHYLSPFLIHPGESNFLHQLEQTKTLCLTVSGTKINEQHLQRLLFYPGTPMVCSLNLDAQSIYHIIYENSFRIDWQFKLTNSPAIYKNILYQPVDIDARVWFLIDGCVRFFYHSPALVSSYLDQIQFELLPDLWAEEIPVSSPNLVTRLIEMVLAYHNRTEEVRAQRGYSVELVFVLFMVKKIKNLTT